jgi:predicted metal-dependent HD superfamily phosphohydrolase
LGLISDVVLLPITGPIRGFVALLKHIQAELDAQMLNEGKVQGELMQLDVRHQAGQVSDAEYEAQQSQLMDKLNQIRAYKEELMEQQAEAAAGVEAETGPP